VTGIHLAAGKMSLTITGSTLLANVTGSNSALVSRHSVVATTTRSAPHYEALAWWWAAGSADRGRLLGEIALGTRMRDLAWRPERELRR
jgi:hypothetical protein